MPIGRTSGGGFLPACFPDLPAMAGLVPLPPIMGLPASVRSTARTPAFGAGTTLDTVPALAPANGFAAWPAFEVGPAIGIGFWVGFWTGLWVGFEDDFMIGFGVAFGVGFGVGWDFARASVRDAEAPFALDGADFFFAGRADVEPLRFTVLALRGAAIFDPPF